MADLPNEIITIILPNLPVKSLLRFKCVSKPWRRWISHPNFRLSNQGQGIIFSARKDYSLSFHFLNQQLTSEELIYPNFKKHDSFSCKLLGSCNGLILISFTHEIFLWNPATRLSTKVLELDRLIDDGYYAHGALCFDSSKNVYKAVMFLDHQTPDYGGEFVLVASLKHKKWRTPKFHYDIPSVQCGITLNGRPHYRVRVKNPDSQDDNSGSNSVWDRAFDPPNKVIYFDPVSDNFHTFPIPEPKYNQENLIVGLGVLNECLCMTRLADDKGVEILVMKEYGVKESWTSLFFVSNELLEINPSYGFAFANPFSMTEKGEVALIISDCDMKVVAYNPKYDKKQDIFGSGIIYQYIFMKESLVSPERYYWSKRRHKNVAKTIWPYCVEPI